MRVAGVAARQWGNVTAAQLRACGLSTSAIGRWKQKGLLHQRHRAVYAFGAPSPAPEARWTAALLAAGDGAHLCRTAALACHGLWTAPRVTHVTASRQGKGDATLRVHTTAHPEVTRRNGIPLTTLPRTFLDLAADHFPIDRLVHEAAARRLLSLAALRAYAADHRGTPGARALTTAATNPHYRSLAERDFHAWLAERGILAVPNAPVDGLTVDFHLPEHGVAIELDFDQTHGTAYAGRRDPARDEVLRRRGLTVVRLDGDSVT
jgi:very-short-patch-repair endonuclease